MRAAARLLDRELDDAALAVDAEGTVSRTAALRALRTLGVDGAHLSDPPTWGELCGAVAQVL
ncbi:hypothetical protein [Truepera radiovictrix]|uniref:Uncharacterized protein n=1 Tax=Truepera radiovictrix (strain DSM 17093 / CIP 108686 / LMG 22925 / RQ-24) TaxID=649638 RepID=D7CR69_TRURR|nr:hypothetical protein [Truepera radiovictrix]ADI15157.1 hypothetical protein Trad_2043 [Truepera radiovictrix DSM 17093]WMT56290.1 hypothetical protein RCV51_09775 [Truepera radiovictrix]